MDFKVQISYTMMAAVFVGQVTSYVCLLTFPAHWGIAPDRALGQDQSRIVLVRMGTQNNGNRVPAISGSGRTTNLNRGTVRGGQTTSHRTKNCQCIQDSTPVMNKSGECNMCNGHIGKDANSRGLASFNMPETYEVHGMDSHRMFPIPANPLADTNIHFNFVASFCTHLFLVFGLQIIKKSPMRMDSLWMAIFVSGILAMMYTLLASNNYSWRHRSFTTACLLTLHKFVILLAISCTLTFNKQLDTLF